MLAKIHAIALNTFREAVRSKALYVVLFFALLLIISSMAFAELSLYEQERVVKDLGLVTITLFSMLISVYIGVSFLFKEIERKTIYTIVPKPIERWQLLAGKYIGILATMAVEVAIMGVIFVGLLVSRDIELSVTLLQSLILIFSEVALISALALLFSSFSTPLLSGLLCGLVFIVGHLHDHLEVLSVESGSDWMRAGMKVAFLVLPDLTLFNISTEFTHNISVSWSYVAYSVGYSGLYSLLLLLLAVAIFNRRDFI